MEVIKLIDGCKIKCDECGMFSGYTANYSIETENELVYICKECMFTLKTLIEIELDKEEE